MFSMVRRAVLFGGFTSGVLRTGECQCWQREDWEERVFDCRGFSRVGAQLARDSYTGLKRPRCLTSAHGLWLASMYDRERASRLVGRATAGQRVVAATLCLYRATVVKDNPASAPTLGTFPDLVDDALDVLRLRIEDPTTEVDFAGFAQRFEEILGPDEAPFEEPYGLSAWAVDVVSLADYVLRTCRLPDESDHACFNVLLASYSFAGMLEDHIDDVASPPLADLEFERQMTDLEALLRGPGTGSPDFRALFSQSDPLRALLAQRFQTVAESYLDGTSQAQSQPPSC